MNMATELPPPGFALPDALLTIETINEAIDAYLAAGLKPILTHVPLADGKCSCGHKHDKTKTGSTSVGKHPIASNWQSHVYTRDELRDHLTRLSFMPNIGVVLGGQPDGEWLIAVDVDDMPRFTALELELGALPETPRCDSGRGYRLFYQAPPEVDVTTLVNVTGLGGEAGVDAKVKGGQVVVAPSLHANGNRYRWTRVGAVAKLPVPWALQLVKLTPPKWIQKYTPQTMQADAKARKRAARYLEAAVIRDAAALAACGEGMRNNMLFQRAFSLFALCAGCLLSHEWAYVHDQLYQAARACGLPEREVRRTLESADKRVRESGAMRTPVVLSTSTEMVPVSMSPPTLPAGTEPPPPLDDVALHEQQQSDPWQIGHSRPFVKVTTELYENVDAAVAALRADTNLYQRDGRLVHVTKVSKEEAEASPHVESDDGEFHRQLVEGSPQIRETGLSTVRERLSRVAVFQKYIESTGKWKPILPTDSIVSAVHARGEWVGIRPIIGVVETPTLRPDGTVMQTPGYDPSTSYLYTPSASFPDVKDEMATQEHARWALQFLNDVFVDFPYISPAHRSVAVAAILTLVARPAIAGSIPAFLFDASTRGSGKTLQTDSIATVATGRGAPRMNYTFDDIEMEKILGGYALKGSSFICLDNVPNGRPFGGGSIDRCITARDKVDLRVLGRTEVLTLAWRALIMATGNNMTLYGDTARRALMARLEPTEESPERRTRFKNADLLAYVRIQRPRLVSAALLLLRAYWRADRPDMGCERWGSFEEWSRLIPNAIVFAGGADPMKARPERDEEVDVETQALACVLDQLPVLHQKLHDLSPDAINGIGVAARTVVSALYEMTPEWSEFEPLREAVETLCKPKGGKSSSGKPDAIALGYKLRAMRSRIVGGRKLVGTLSRSNVMMWRVEKTTS
jgi:hypothetical protein